MPDSKHIGSHRDWFSHHAGFELLNDENLLCLVGNSHVLVDNAHTTFLGQRYRESRLRDGVHCCRQQRNAEPNFTG